ncbi:hypothetical protein BGW36DRAFT_394177 [Talaromyces proteolyticus]|uniref:Zn(2)-C6 fungal-type domain-containing protein n=1 Tax=Talaromyces proteolyticus TaxID=1131652 RepID=A0AAD4KYR5_9EURO|nr:uncharacterized protein BGW36DRAFT_394177 [Talaromyces proteolyticus]KAH8704005.1 hypothetical protein BGW36DRAFT_394177 [Talaromyces proteolyticus]
MSNPARSDEPKSKKPTNRQLRSCRVCRLRKVKCDRVKPCHACCAHGHPSRCVYDLLPGDEEAQPISQAEEIRNLRNEIKDLRTRISSQGDNKSRSRKLEELEKLFDAIRSAPVEIVDNLVGNIRGDRLRISPGHDGNDTRSSSGSSSSSSASTISIDEDWCGPLSRFVSAKPMVDGCVQRFVDAFSPEVDASSGHAGAIRAAADIRMFSPMISNAFEAVSLTFFGRSVQDPGVEAAGMKLYPKVLRSLQDALLDPERSRSEATLITVTLLLAFESIERTSNEGVTAHVKGAARLIQHRGPENHMYGVEHLLFCELRPYWTGVDIIDRKPSFMAEEAWKTVPWSQATTSKDLLHYLLDLVVEIPGLLWQYDELMAAQETQHLGKGELRVKRTKLWNSVTDLTSRFEQWKKDYVDCYPSGAPQETTEPQGPDPFPVFQCHDLRTMQVIKPPSLIYPDLRLLQSMCIYSSSRLILSTIDDRPEDAVTMVEKYQLACDIARSLECYIRRAPGNMINRLAFAVRVAWEAFPPGDVERHFMIQVFELVEKRHALRLWGSSMPELSARTPGFTP